MTGGLAIFGPSSLKPDLQYSVQHISEDPRRDAETVWILAELSMFQCHCNVYTRGQLWRFGPQMYMNQRANLETDLRDRIARRSLSSYCSIHFKEIFKCTTEKCLVYHNQLKIL